MDIEFLKKSFPDVEILIISQKTSGVETLNFSKKIISGCEKIDYFTNYFWCGKIEYFKKLFPGCREIEFFKKSFFECGDTEFFKKTFRVWRD